MFKKSAMTAIVLVAAIGASWAGQASATAADNGFNARHVSYADLDLSRSHDAKVLVDRIKWAASKVCEINGDSGMDRLSRSYRSCVRTASANAIAELNNGMVTAAYEGKSAIEVATK